MVSIDITRFLNFLCIGFLLVREMANACNMTAVNTCTEILSHSTDGSVLTDGISAIPTVQQLKKLCGAMDGFKACYKPKAAECTRDLVFSMTFGTIENTIDYLCIEGYKDILQYATCWNQTEVIEESTKCHIAQNSMIATLHSQQISGQLDAAAMRKLWCEILENTTACMQAGVEPKCGKVPGCIMHTMMSRALKGLSSLMKCAAPTSCQIPSNGTTQNQNDHHPGHDSATDADLHTDGTRHTHGDSHSDHAHDGQADAEVTDNDPGSPAASATYSSFLINFSFSVIYVCLYNNSF